MALYMASWPWRHHSNRMGCRKLILDGPLRCIRAIMIYHWIIMVYHGELECHVFHMLSFQTYSIVVKELMNLKSYDDQEKEIKKNGRLYLLEEIGVEF